MKWNAIFIGIVTGLTLALIFVFTLSASAGGRETFRDRDVNAAGAMRVDRDLYALHPYDVNQFGNDEAYNSLDGRSAVPYPFHIER